MFSIRFLNVDNISKAKFSYL